MNWLPTCAEVDGIIINKTLFDEYNVPVPTDYTSFVSACETFEAAGIRTYLDDRSEKIGYKIRQAEMQKTPYMIVVGQKEVDNRQVNVRTYKDGERGVMTPEDLKAEVRKVIDNRTLDVNIKKLDIDQFIHAEDVDAEERDY